MSARASDAQKAERLNLARTLLQEHPHLPDAADRLARDCAISTRQAYRYLAQAQQLTRPVPIADAKVSFTVKLSHSLVDKLRSYAASTGFTLSEIVSQARPCWRCCIAGEDVANRQVRNSLRRLRSSRCNNQGINIELGPDVSCSFQRVDKGTGLGVSEGPN